MNISNKNKQRTTKYSTKENYATNSWNNKTKT